MTDHSQTARWLRDQHRAGARFVPFARAQGAATLADAYAVQEAHVAAMQADGMGEVRGWKIGLTSLRMQQMCGIDQPVAGAVLASRLHASGSTVRLADHGRLGLEFEICLRLGADLPARAAPYTAAEVAGAVDAAAAAVEMVDDRNCDYATLDVESLIADNSWNAGVVLGDWAPVPADLTGCEGVVTLNGAHLDRGLGRDALGGAAGAAGMAGEPPVRPRPGLAARRSGDDRQPDPDPVPGGWQPLWLCRRRGRPGRSVAGLIWRRAIAGTSSAGR